MDHLFWRVLPYLEDHQFAWILWYIWKGKNNKVLSNLDVDPIDTLKLVEMESLLWTAAHASLTQRTDQSRLVMDETLPTIPGRWYGSWKAQENYSRQGWYNTLAGFDGLMGARNTRVSQSPSHSEANALIWVMECIKNLI